MRDETLAALKAWRSSRALALDESKFYRIISDIRKHSDADLWSAAAPQRAVTKKPTDPLMLAVKSALAKYKEAASVKAKRLVQHMLPERATFPKSMPAALRLLRNDFADDEIASAAAQLMEILRRESGTEVPL